MIKFLPTLAMIMACSSAFAQDILTKTSGEDILSKIVEVNDTIVKYKKFEALNGPVYQLLKSDVLMIRYENGTKDIFKQNISSVSPALTGAELYARGKQDAMTYYKGYKGAGTGTFVTGLISPLAGLIPAIACSSTKPKDENLDYPDASLMKNSEYHRGYTQTAKKIKSGKVWKNWLITFGINIVAVLAIDANH